MAHLVLPLFDELPAYKHYSGCAWSVWAPDDQLGTVNLLTEDVVKLAAKEEIKTGKSVSLNWPINFPAKPLFNRRAPEINLLVNPRGRRDDEIHINTLSGSHWDGMRHCGTVEYGVFYNDTPAKSLPKGIVPFPNPNQIDPNNSRIGIQNWSNHGICGRGVLLDLVRYYTRNGSPLPYNLWSTHGFSVEDLQAVANHQGVQFRTGDILILRVGFIQKYYAVTDEEREALSERPPTFAGIEQSEDMKRFLWNNHFSAVASDQPTLEKWPPSSPATPLYQTILGLWGMPLGNMFDLEELSGICAETGRYTFFFSSWPLNIIGGAASPPNAAAYF